MPALVVTLGATKFRAAFACAEAVDESPFADPKFWCRFSQSRMRGWLRVAAATVKHLDETGFRIAGKTGSSGESVGASGRIVTGALR